MNIVKAHIYGFGKWKDESWELTENDINLFKGENESGKSTFMAFIKAVLFGFPKKGDNQFLPVDTDAYGGHIKLKTKKYGEVTVERVKGRKASGEVTVFFEDGTKGGEKELEQFLDGLDLGAFQGIFHFDLDGLNGISSMNPEELNQFLFDTGLGGGQSISQIEKRITADMESYFKPRGKVTEINQLGKRIAEKEREVRRWEERLAQYDTLQSKVAQLKEELSRNKHTQESLREKVKAAEKHEMIQPLAKSWEEKQVLLGEEEAVEVFPEKGIERLESLVEKRMDKQSHLRDERLKLELIQDEIKTINAPSKTQLLKMQESIQEYEVYKHRQMEEQQILREESQLKGKLQTVEKEWEETAGVSFGPITPDPVMGSRLKALKEQYTPLKQDEHNLSVDFSRTVNKLLEKETELSKLQESLVTDDELVALEKKLSNLNNKEQLLNEKNTVTRQMALLEKEQQFSSQRLQQGKLFFILLACLFTGAAFFSWPETTLTILFGVLAVFFVGLALKKQMDNKASNTSNLQEEKRELAARLEEIDLEMKGQAGVDETKLKNVVASQREKKQLAKELVHQIQSLKERKNYLQEDVEKVTSLKAKVLKDLKSWCTDYHLPYKEAFVFYEEVLAAYERWRNNLEQVEKLRQKRLDIRRLQEPFEKNVYQLFEEIGEPQPEKSISKLMEHLKLFVNEGQSFIKRKEALQEKQSMKKEAISTLEQELTQIENELTKLLQQGGSKSEEAFRRTGRLFERQEMLKAERQQTWTQMKLIIRDEEQLKLVIQKLLEEEYEPAEQLATWNEEWKKHQTVAEELMTELAACRQELNVLVEDGSYEDLLQELTQMREELNTLAKKWAVLAVSKHIIQEIKVVYEQEKQPAVLQDAEKLFQQMTNGEYTRLFAPLGEERFVLERKDGVRFDPVQVSRGTCELLYLALRFALAGRFSKGEGFPLIMDETLVNIDRNRRMRIIDVLYSIAKERQILLFSCHHHICEEVKGNLIDLSSRKETSISL